MREDLSVVPQLGFSQRARVVLAKRHRSSAPESPRTLFLVESLACPFNLQVSQAPARTDVTRITPRDSRSHWRQLLLLRLLPANMFFLVGLVAHRGRLILLLIYPGLRDAHGQ